MRDRLRLPAVVLLEGERLTLALEDRGPTLGAWLIVRLAAGPHHAMLHVAGAAVEDAEGHFESCLRQLRADLAAAAAASAG